MELHDFFKTPALSSVREMRPLIHCITNYVTAGAVADMILAAGGSPVMADGVREVEEVTERSHALVLNLGTLREETVPSMILAGKRAARLGHPIVLDPVGAGASAFRTETARMVLREVSCTAVRGNRSEIRALFLGESHGGGVDEAPETPDFQKEEVMAFARDYKVLLAVTGTADLITDGHRICTVRNGDPMLARITGTGCMLDGIMAAFLAVSEPKDHFAAAVLAVAALGLCGESARKKAEGTGSFRVRLLDEMSNLCDEVLRKGVQIEI